MGDIFFVLKSLALTLIVVLLLQLRVGGKTLESHSMNWIHESSAVEILQSVAEGGARLIREGFSNVSELIGRSGAPSYIDSVSESSRLQILKLKRSDAYAREWSSSERRPQSDGRQKNQDEGYSEERRIPRESRN
jgi:hypothetical protein